MLILVLGTPVAVIAGIYLGRLAMKNWWQYHLPYEDRHTATMAPFGGGRVPRIPPKGSGWW